MTLSSLWVARLWTAYDRIAELLWVIIMYLASELTIWGLSRVMAPIHLEFFASILGMTVVFLSMTTMYLFRRRFENFYRQKIKSKVDFVNAHMAIGFPIPLIMMNPDELLVTADIARIIAVFVITNVTSWTTCFTLYYVAIGTIIRVKDYLSNSEENERKDEASPAPLIPPRLSLNMAYPPVLPHTDPNEQDRDKGCSTAVSTPTFTSRQNSIDCEPTSAAEKCPVWSKILAQYPLFISFHCIFMIGTPVLVMTGDSRILDGCVLWFIWITAVRMQRLFKQSDSCHRFPRIKNAMATFMNPVLMTTLLMMAYTRAKASAIPGQTLESVLADFSGGKPFYVIWTASVTNTPIPSNPTGYFGAGDAALSILEAGILIWGFKLYECRTQLYSVAGLLTVVVATAAAVGNVYLCVICARVVGLHPTEALSFSARSTTLALAKPAIEAVGGNMVVNAALVVSNGILGQLMYPFILGRMGVKQNKDAPTGRHGRHSSTSDSQCTNSSSFSANKKHRKTKDVDDDDDPMTIAAGVAIGINGAAMGVAYLYETKSRAAPYAALSMTIFGVMTVVCTTAEPFKSVLLSLAGWSES